MEKNACKLALLIMVVYLGLGIQVNAAEVADPSTQGNTEIIQSVQANFYYSVCRTAEGTCSANPGMLGTACGCLTSSGAIPGFICPLEYTVKYCTQVGQQGHL